MQPSIHECIHIADFLKNCLNLILCRTTRFYGLPILNPNFKFRYIEWQNQYGDLFIKILKNLRKKLFKKFLTIHVLAYSGES